MSCCVTPKRARVRACAQPLDFAHRPDQNPSKVKWPKPTDAFSMPSQPPPRKRPSREAIVRAVASSTAIETGERIAIIEARLRNLQTNFVHLSLAFTRPARPAQG